VERKPDKILRLADGERFTIGESVVQVERRGTRILVCVWSSFHIAKFDETVDNADVSLEKR
jgi:hypothetical protein